MESSDSWLWLVDDVVAKDEAGVMLLEDANQKKVCFGHELRGKLFH